MATETVLVLSDAHLGGVPEAVAHGMPGDERSHARLFREIGKDRFFGETPDFDEILRVVGDFEQRFNRTAAS